MSSPVIVIDAAEKDKVQIFELHREMFRHEIEECWGWDEQWQKENFEKEWGRDVFKVIRHQDEVIGYSQFTKEKDKIYIQSIGLIPDFRNQGLGTMLMERILKEAQESGGDVELSVHSKNKVALKLYEKFGFEVIDSTDHSVSMKLKHECLTRRLHGTPSHPAPNNPTT